MNPDVAIAVDELETRGTLSAAQAAVPRRVARGELLSLRGELSVLLYAGVLMVTAGAGILVKENLSAIGPIGIAVGLGVAALLCLAWVAKTAPAFSWEAVPSPHLAFDYLLLLGVLLGAADLAYIEFQFTPLGANWPWHFLIVAIVGLILAVRYDSRLVLSLALSSFAAWRGVSVSFLEWRWWSWPEEVLRANMIVCGLVFLGLGMLFVITHRKTHFGPVAMWLGWILLLGALFSGIFDELGTWALMYSAFLLAIGGFLAWRSMRDRKFPLFALGVVGAYAGLSGMVMRGVGFYMDDVLVLGWFAVSSLAILAALVLGHAAMKRRP